MKRFLTFTLVAALVVGATSVVYANVCAFDVVPAATLLFPFAQLDFNDPENQENTFFAITNVSAEAQIAHVTVWSDVSEAIIDFNIVLSGYDVQTFDLKSIFALDGGGFTYGWLPRTGTDGNSWYDGKDLEIDGAAPFQDGPYVPMYDDPMDPYGTWTIYERCPPTFISYPDYPQIQNDTRIFFKTKAQWSQTVLRGHSDCDNPGGSPSTYGDWFETRDLTDPTWYYLTVDVVWTCNKQFPYEVSYFQEPTGIDELGGQRMLDNVLIGDVLWLNPSEQLSEADNAVHIEADIDLASVATMAGDVPISFYHRYAYGKHNLLNAQDYREPLPTAWALRYMGVAQTDTYLRVWKGGTVAERIQDLHFVGGAVPDYLGAFDCIAYTYYAWDEDENPYSGPGGPDDDPWSGTVPPPPDVVPNLLPLETQEVHVEWFNTPAANGWMLFVWPRSNGWEYPYNGGVAGLDYYQTWMGVKYVTFGEFSAFLQGAVMANFNCFEGQTLPDLGVNWNYINVNGYIDNVP